MELPNIKQPPYNTSLMGVLQGAGDYYGLGLSKAQLFGGTGHAFLINVHEELCPSSPYVWDPEPLFKLSRNIGLDITDLGFFGGEVTVDERRSLEARVRDYLDEGSVCGVLNMDNQIVYGYNDGGLLLAEPWGEMGMTPPRLSFDTWIEFGEEQHVSFFAIKQCEPADAVASIVDALQFAVEIYDHPDRYAQDHYGMAREAFENWVKALKSGHGGEHGAWWNATVWSECRAAASDYLTYISEQLPDTKDVATRISTAYRRVADSLARAADREMASTEKITLIEAARDEDSKAISSVRGLIDLIGSE